MIASHMFIIESACESHGRHKRKTEMDFFKWKSHDFSSSLVSIFMRFSWILMVFNGIECHFICNY